VNTSSTDDEQPAVMDPPPPPYDEVCTVSATVKDQSLPSYTDYMISSLTSLNDTVVIDVTGDHSTL